MSCQHLEECIKPGTPKVISDWVIFTNFHHNSHRTHDETVSSFKGTVLGSYIDFNTMEKLMKKSDEKTVDILPEVQRIDSSDRLSVVISFNDQEITELFNLLDSNKRCHNKLFEKVYHEMTRTLFLNVNRKIQNEIH